MVRSQKIDWYAPFKKAVTNKWLNETMEVVGTLNVIMLNTEIDLLFIFAL